MATPVNYITEYNKKIKSGKIVAGKWVKLLYAYLVNGLRKRSFFRGEKQEGGLNERYYHNRKW